MSSVTTSAVSSGWSLVRWLDNLVLWFVKVEEEEVDVWDDKTVDVSMPFPSSSSSTPGGVSSYEKEYLNFYFRHNIYDRSQNQNNYRY